MLYRDLWNPTEWDWVNPTRPKASRSSLTFIFLVLNPWVDGILNLLTDILISLLLFILGCFSLTFYSSVWFGTRRTCDKHGSILILTLMQ